MEKNKVVSIVVVVAVLALAGFFIFGGNGAGNLGTELSTERVATVNGVAISKSVYDAQLASSVASFKTQGVDVEDAEKLAQIKTQVLNDLINNELVAQGVKEAGLGATLEEVGTQLEAIIEQAGGDAKYQEELVKANITEAQLKADITKQIGIQKYLSANIDVTKISVTDKEISTFYSEYSAAQKTASSTIKVPALKDLSAQIKQQITLNKQQDLVTSFLETLRAKATIDIVQ